MPHVGLLGEPQAQ